MSWVADDVRGPWSNVDLAPQLLAPVSQRCLFCCASGEVHKVLEQSCSLQVAQEVEMLLCFNDNNGGVYGTGELFSVHIFTSTTDKLVKIEAHRGK